MNENEKLVSLSFDEVYISHDICYDKITEQVIGPQKTVQVVMVRVMVPNLLLGTLPNHGNKLFFINMIHR